LGFNGDLYPTAGASVVMTTSGDMVKYQSGARTRLGIGSANQILQVKSSLPSWETVDLADTVLTTAGDVLFENATPELARLPKGTQYNNLQMGSALPAWSASSTSVLTASGDVLYASGSNTLAKLAKASDGDTLQLASGVPAWVTVSAGGGAWSFLQGHTFDGTETDHTFTTDYNVADYSEFHIVYHGHGGGTMNIEWDEQTIKYYGFVNWIYSGGETQTVTSDSSSVTIGVSLSATYQNHFDIHISASNYTSGTCYGTVDGGQGLQISSFGRVLTNNTSGIIREIKFTFTTAPTNTCEIQMYGLSNS